MKCATCPTIISANAAHYEHDDGVQCASCGAERVWNAPDASVFGSLYQVILRFLAQLARAAESWGWTT